LEAEGGVLPPQHADVARRLLQDLGRWRAVMRGQAMADLGWLGEAASLSRSA
jgi:hypothetical protein